jgi:hypothetical protein
MDAYSLRPDELPDLTIETLGSPMIDSPLIEGKRHFIDDGEKVLLFSHSENLKASKDSGTDLPMFERAGPRRKIFFEPEKLNCGIVTCGGLCPGLAIQSQSSLWFSIRLCRPVLEISRGACAANTGAGK